VRFTVLQILEKARFRGERQYRRGPRRRSYPQSPRLNRGRLYARIALNIDPFVRRFSTSVDYGVDAPKTLQKVRFCTQLAVDKWPLFGRLAADMLALPPWTAV
jgi:hypothetical protein